MNLPRLTAVLLGLLLSLPVCLAGGSVDWGFHALPILRKNPALLQIITTSLDVATVGTGVRLGHDSGDDAGKRIPPFAFPARLKGQTGPYNLTLIVNDPATGMNNGETKPWIEIHAMD